MVPLCSSRHLAFVDSPPDLYDLQKASLSNLAGELPVIEILHQRGPWRLDQVISRQILDGRRQFDIGVRHVLYGCRRIGDPERTQGVEPVEPVSSSALSCRASSSARRQVWSSATRPPYASTRTACTPCCGRSYADCIVTTRGGSCRRTHTSCGRSTSSQSERWRPSSRRRRPAWPIPGSSSAATRSSPTTVAKLPSGRSASALADHVPTRPGAGGGG